MPLKTLIRAGEYLDSITVMSLAARVRRLPGVSDASVIMASSENKTILRSAGLLTPEAEDASDSDLLIVVNADGTREADDALREAERYLESTLTASFIRSQAQAPSLETALKRMPAANMAVISVAGRFAADLSMECLQRGLHVMLFSDNVPVEREEIGRAHV